MATQPDIEPLYLAMTRPPMIWGVPMLYVGVSGLAVCLIFIWTKFLPLLLLYPLVHAAGYWMFEQDCRFMDIWMAWSRHCAKCQTRRLYGVNLYLGD